jgi:serine acetyltransferase
MNTIRLAVGLLLGGASTIGCGDRTPTLSDSVPPAPTAIVMGQIDLGHP